VNSPIKPATDSAKTALLADPALRKALARFVRGKVPEHEIDDIVQASLVDALAAARVPEEPSELRRWVHGIARHKIADYFRLRAREHAPDGVGVDVPADSAAHSARDLLRWAEGQLPEGEQGEQAQRTLDVMLREGDGEKLEWIAEEQEVEAPALRQRVARLRRLFRERWAQQLAAVAAVLLLVLAGIFLWRRGVDPETPIVREVPSAEPSPLDRARELRRVAFEDCKAKRWELCLEVLDQARALDPVGDRTVEVQGAREEAARALKLETPPAPTLSAPPDRSAIPYPETDSGVPRPPRPVRTDTAPPPKAPTMPDSDSLGGK
jgi:DNA-directed RNA polymerase specialized sigma24 family protein